MDRSAVRDSLNLLRKVGYSTSQYDWLLNQSSLLDLLAPQVKSINVPSSPAEASRILKSPSFDNLEFMQGKLFETIKLIRAKVGILSLSERFDSLPMWAHYADNAKGFVIVLEDLARSFKGDETGSLNIPKPVLYDDEFHGMTFDPCTQERLFFSKLRDWSYEREWRVVTDLESCVLSPNGKQYLRQVDPLHLTEVIYGWRTDKQELSSTRAALKDINPGAQFTEASLREGRVILSPAV